MTPWDMVTCADGKPHACTSGQQFSEHYDETPHCTCRCGARHIEGTWQPPSEAVGLKE